MVSFWWAFVGADESRLLGNSRPSLRHVAPKPLSSRSRPLVSAAGGARLDAVDMASPRLEFRILGPLTLRVDGAVVHAGGPKQRALLALLLLSANRVFSRERLSRELFADQSPDSAGHAIHNHVSRLRKLVSPRRRTSRAWSRDHPATCSGSSRESSTWSVSSGSPPTAARRSPAATRRQRPPRSAQPRSSGPAGRSRISSWRGSCASRPSGSTSSGWRRSSGGSTLSSRSEPPRARPRARDADRRLPVSRALPWAADARALPLRPSGRESRPLPAHAEAPERRARPRAERRSAEARACDPRAGPGLSVAEEPGARRAAVSATPRVPVQGPRAVRGGRRAVLLRPRAA